MRDFVSVLRSLGIYREENHNKTENIFHLYNNEIEFFGLDEPQKVRGRGRQLLWMNEANEFSLEDFTQLNLRTSGQVFMDYNPSEEDHWIYDKILTRPDCTLIESTYRDALKFLEPEVVAEIERLEHEDENYWRIYGLGQRGHRQSTIYTNWDVVPEFPECDEVLYGIDFGFNNPSVLVAVGFRDGELYLDERIYQSRLTNAEFMPLMDREIPEEFAPIYADSEDPQRIAEIANFVRSNGQSFNVHPCEKGKDSVREGIDRVKSYKVHVTARSSNIISEIKSYKWKEDKNGHVLDEPVKFKDHTMDAIRYPVFSHPLAGKFEVVFET